MRERFLKIAKPTAIFLALGFPYFLIHELTGFAIPCPVRSVFRVYCPGCGVSRMLFHLVRFEFAQAFSANCLLFCLLPIAVFEAAFHAVRYIRTGNGRFSRPERVLLWTAVVLLLLFGVIRNIWQVQPLIP